MKVITDNYEPIGGPPPGPNCFYSPPADSIFWNGEWWKPKQKAVETGIAVLSKKLKGDKSNG